MIEILNGGPLSSIQDCGRDGFRRYGAPISGAMDMFALRVANILVGNSEKTTGIEVTFYGLRLKACDDLWIAVTGGDLSPRINNEPIPMWTSLRLEKGDVLSFNGMKSGFRAYVAVRGGWEVPLVMNSYSTSIRGGFGGTGGPLKAGDKLKTGKKSDSKRLQSIHLPDGYIPEYPVKNKLRVVWGPQRDYFSPEGLEMFLNSEYIVTSQSDRQGYRLDGPEIEHTKGYNIISEPTWPGAIQIPGDGLPIILLADAQTTGGYPKIASVISADLDKLGQSKASDRMSFESVLLEAAHRQLLKKESILEEIKKTVRG